MGERELPAGLCEGKTSPAPKAESTDWLGLTELVAGLIRGRIPSSLEREGLDWFVVAGLADLQGVSPLLHLALNELPEVTVPAEVKAALAAYYRDAAHASLRQEVARRALCGCLGERAIPVLLLKGTALAITCYADPATRPMGDLDVLIPRGRVEEAARCLEQSGFRPASGSLALELQSPRSHLSYRHEGTRVPVELHWELKLLGRAERRATAEIWAGARAPGIEGNALVMGLGHTLPLLCAHMLLQHREPRLIWLYDLHRVLLKMDAAEARLARDAATRWGLGPCTALALLRARELFGTLLPEELTGWSHAMSARRDLQARVAAQALVWGTEAPSEYLLGLLMNRTFSPLRTLFPTPDDLRHRLGLSADARVGPAAYASFLIRRLSNSPLHLRQLWRFWRSASASSPVAAPQQTDEISPGSAGTTG